MGIIEVGVVSYIVVLAVLARVSSRKASRQLKGSLK